MMEKVKYFVLVYLVFVVALKIESLKEYGYINHICKIFDITIIIFYYIVGTFLVLAILFYYVLKL